MSNELTILRFHAREGGIPPVSPGSVALICDNLAALFSDACRSSGWNGSTARFEYFVAPRKGSLEIVFRHILEMVESASTFTNEDWDTFGNAAGVGSLFWVALFGGNGVVDLFRTDLKSPPRPSSVGKGVELRLQLTEKLLRDREAQKHIRGLLDSCILPGVSRVEIEVLDEPPVLLFGSEDRLQPRLLARGRQRTPHLAAAQGIKGLASKGGPVIAGKYKEKPVRIFLGSGSRDTSGVGGSDTFVILWGSSADVPRPGGWVEVKAEPVDDQSLERLTLDEAVPFEFEEAEGVLFVSAVSVWT